MKLNISTISSESNKLHFLIRNSALKSVILIPSCRVYYTIQGCLDYFVCRLHGDSLPDTAGAGGFAA